MTTGLRRVIGVRTLTLSVINFIIGSAIFVVPAAVAKELGSAAVLAYLVAAMLVLTVALCFAEAGSRVTATGGAYAYVERAFGPWAGFVVATLMLVANGVVAVAAVANVLVGSLATVVPSLRSGAPRALFLTVLFAGFALLNIRGAKPGSRAVVILTVLKLTPLLILLVAGLGSVQIANLAWIDQPTIGGLARGSLLLVFALTGMEIALTPTGEVENPARTVPIAALLGVAVTAALYIGIHLVAQGVLGADLASFSAAPLAAVAERVLGPVGGGLMVAGAVVSTTGYLSGDMLSTPRSLYALASDGLLPKGLSAVHQRFQTPWVAIAVYGSVSLLLTIMGTFQQLAILNAVGVLTIYLAVILALFKLRRDGVVSDRAPLALPGAALIRPAALGLTLVLLATAARRELLAVAGFVAVASFFYFGWRRASAKTAGSSSPGRRVD
ncbi:MAG: APC family permease [Gemmatimonadales bacterium]